jgi:DNA-directed RNA polymerase subunit F
MKNKRLSKKNSKLNSLAFSEKGLSPKLPASNDELSVLTYKNGDTLELCNKNKKIYKETDKKFIEDVGNIVKVKKNMFLEILNTGIPSLKLENKVCDELDYIARKHSKANTINENSRKAFENINEIDKCKCGCNRGKGKLLSLLTN